MITVFVNDRRLIICHPSDLQDCELHLRADELSGKRLEEVIASFEENHQLKSLALISDDPDLLWKKIYELYKVLEAAGGIVINEFAELLMIYRNDRWDLPKGKIENDESPDLAAIREVEEECGVKNLMIKKSAGVTYHTYPYGAERILKITHWYHMFCPKQEVTPQAEEGITKAVWLSIEDVKAVAGMSYVSIADLLARHFLKN